MFSMQMVLPSFTNNLLPLKGIPFLSQEFASSYHLYLAPAPGTVFSDSWGAGGQFGVLDI